MIKFVDGPVAAEADLTGLIILTPQDQAALAQSINNGTCLLRMYTNTLHGAATLKITGIDMSFYDPWNGGGTSGIVYAARTFGTATTINAGDTEYAMQDLSGLKELAVYPTILRLKVSTVTLGGADVIDGLTIGIVMSCPR